MSKELTKAQAQFQAGEFKRIGKGGKEVWLQAVYNPILDPDGKPFRVIKFATDVTATKLQNADYQGQIAAVNKAQAVIEFNLDGTVINANDTCPTSPSKISISFLRKGLAGRIT